MKKLLYIAPVGIDLENLDGVPKKVLQQCEAFSNFYDVDIVYYNDRKVCIYNVLRKENENIGVAKNRIGFFKCIKCICLCEKYHFSYIRFPKSDFFFISLLKFMKNHEIKMVMEIPTYPYNLEGNETIKGRIKNHLDKLFSKKLRKYIGRIVTYSNDEIIFGIKTIRTINGIKFDEKFLYYNSISLNELYLVAISAMYRVHGYDRFIEGLHNYYSEGHSSPKPKIVLKLIGCGDALNQYKELVTKYKLEDYVVFCGALFGEALEKEIAGCACGINSLAIHRQGLINESTLKTKEYALHGLPIISSSYVDAFSSDGNNKFVLRVLPDESPIDINNVYKFIERIYSKNDIENIRKTIFNDSIKVCSIEHTLDPIIRYFGD